MNTVDEIICVICQLLTNIIGMDNNNKIIIAEGMLFCAHLANLECARHLYCV